MLKSFVQIGLEALIKNGELDGSLRSYSGRGMYGKSCLAMTVESSADLFSLGMQLALCLNNIIDMDDYDGDDLNGALADELAQGVRTDNMGTGQVVYFPGIEYVEE